MQVKYVVGGVLLILWVAYFIGAMVYHFGEGYNPSNEPAIRLISINVIAVFCVSYWAVKKYFGRTIWKECLKPCVDGISSFISKHWNVLQW